MTLLLQSGADPSLAFKCRVDRLRTWACTFIDLSTTDGLLRKQALEQRTEAFITKKIPAG